MIRIGTILHGYCGGEFGGAYECKRVEAIGADWVVARGLESGKPLAAYQIPERLEEYTNRDTQADFRGGCCEDRSR